MSVFDNPVTTARSGILVSALIIHVIFNRVEPRSEAALLLLLVAVPFSLGFGLKAFYGSFIRSFFETQLLFFTTLISSVVLYRLSPVHPLYQYPGPILLRISRLAALRITLTGKQHEHYRALHEKYGPYVRTGPNHIHISDASALPKVLFSTRFIKSDRYNAVKRHGNMKSLLSITEPKEHSQRRRLWDRGLNTAALKEYHPALYTRIDQLIAGLTKSGEGGKEVNLAEWLAFFAVDFMGDLAWGGVFSALEDGNDVNGLLKMSRTTLLVHESAGVIPWIRPFYNSLPVPAKAVKQIEFAKRTVLERMKRGPGERPDLFSHLIGENEETGEKLNLSSLISETVFAMVAGTDTSAATLANTFYYLLAHPDTLKRLRNELAETEATTELTPTVLGGLPYLNAIINETLRLQPVVPNGVQRVLLPGPAGQGEVLGRRHYIPPNTNLQISTYCVQRDPKHFSPYPDAFWPERWLPNARELLKDEKEEFRLDEQAYFPFSLGPTGCAGKALALMEIRTAVAALVSNFDLTLVEGWDTKEWERDLEDFFTFKTGRLPVRVVSRK